MSATLHQQICYCCCVVYLETVFSFNDSSNLWQAINTASSSMILMWVFLPFFAGHLPRRTDCSCGPHNPPWRHLLSTVPLIRVWILTLVVAWRCTTKAGSGQPLSLASALLTYWPGSCNPPWASIVGQECNLASGSAILAKFLKASSFVIPLYVGRRPLWLPGPLLLGPSPGEVTRSYSVCWTPDPSV